MLARNSLLARLAVWAAAMASLNPLLGLFALGEIDKLDQQVIRIILKTAVALANSE